jgi:hypothetical protein
MHWRGHDSQWRWQRKSQEGGTKEPQNAGCKEEWVRWEAKGRWESQGAGEVCSDTHALLARPSVGQGSVTGLKREVRPTPHAIPRQPLS